MRPVNSPELGHIRSCRESCGYSRTTCRRVAGSALRLSRRVRRIGGYLLCTLMPDTRRPVAGYRCGSPPVSLRGITLIIDSETNAAPMGGPEHFRRAEELAAEAHKLLGQADGQATAGVWAAVAETHALLALAAATAVGTLSPDSRAWADAAGDPALVQLVAREDPARGPCQEKTATGKGCLRRLPPGAPGCGAHSCLNSGRVRILYAIKGRSDRQIQHCHSYQEARMLPADSARLNHVLFALVATHGSSGSGAWLCWLVTKKARQIPGGRRRTIAWQFSRLARKVYDR